MKTSSRQTNIILSLYVMALRETAFAFWDIVPVQLCLECPKNICTVQVTAAELNFSTSKIFNST